MTNVTTGNYPAHIHTHVCAIQYSKDGNIYFVYIPFPFDSRLALTCVVSDWLFACGTLAQGGNRSDMELLFPLLDFDPSSKSRSGKIILDGRKILLLVSILL